MKNINRPKWKDVISFASEILDHGDQQILMEILKTFNEQDSEEYKDAMHEKAMKRALGDKMTTTDFDAMVDLAALLLREGHRFPKEFAEFTADVLEGKRSRPTKRGSDPHRDFFRNVALSFTAEAVAQKFGIARYANGNTNNETAVDAVSEAAKYTTNTVRHALRSRPISHSIIATVVARLGAKLDR